jgi:NADH-quinone oxidoreductase subunit M
VPATAGVILAAVYMLWMYQRVMFNGVTREENRDVPDLDRRELAILVPIAVLIVWLGVYPKPFLDKIEPAVQTLVERMESAPGFAEAPSARPAALASPGRR